MDTETIYIVKQASGYDDMYHEHIIGWCKTEEEAKAACEKLDKAIPIKPDQKLIDLYEELYDQWWLIEEDIISERSPYCDYSKDLGIPGLGQVVDADKHSQWVDEQNRRIKIQRAEWYIKHSNGLIDGAWLDAYDAWDDEQYIPTHKASYEPLNRM